MKIPKTWGATLGIYNIWGKSEKGVNGVLDFRSKNDLQVVEEEQKIHSR